MTSWSINVFGRGLVVQMVILPFLAALLVGATFNRYIVRAGTLADMSTDTFRTHLAASIRALLSTATSQPSENSVAQAASDIPTAAL
jgi:hypothetical protein